MKRPAVGFPIDADGIWCEIREGTVRHGAALFLDRDGVVVRETEYLHRVADMEIIPGAAKVITAANKRGIAVVIVTNQGGIGRGLYGWQEFLAVQTALREALRCEDAQIDAVYACPHHPLGCGDFGHPDHPARKPNPGMIIRAARDLELDLGRSWLVGDKSLDIEAARRAGLAGALQVMTGHGAAERARSATLATAAFEVRFGRSITDALQLPIFESG